MSTLCTATKCGLPNVKKDAMSNRSQVFQQSSLMSKPAEDTLRTATATHRRTGKVASFINTPSLGMHLIIVFNFDCPVYDQLIVFGCWSDLNSAQVNH